MSKRNRNHTAVAAANEPAQARSNSPIAYILEQQKLRTRQDLLKLRLAIDTAENPQNPSREMLHNIYREIEKDLALTSNWESRCMKVKEKPFKMVNEAGKEDDKKTKLLQQPWFFEWIDAALEAHLWQFSLIEFGPLDLKTGEFLPYEVNNRIFDPITVIDRDNVKPEFGIITSSPSEMTGKKFTDPDFKDYLMFVGSHGSRGLQKSLYWKAAKYILFKDNALGNWSEWAEVFGMDKRVGYTDVEGPARDRFLKAIQNIGANAYGVFGSRDRIEYLGTQRQDAYQVYNQLMLYIDQSIAKLVFGQDVVSNNTGKVVGSVGENIANMYGNNDALLIMALANNKLFPLMENLGFRQFAGYHLEWDTSEKVSLTERSTIDLAIKNMGFKHSADYINRTYGTEVEEAEEQIDPSKVAKDINDLYE